MPPVGSQAWYQLQPGESIPAYNARIAAANPNLPAPGTTSSTGITNNATPGNVLQQQQQAPVAAPAPAPAPVAPSPIITAPRSTPAPAPAPAGITSNLPATPPPLAQARSIVSSNLPATPPPQQQSTGQLPPLPPIQSQSGSLSAFADLLNAGVQRAKQQRNQLIGGMMQPQQGTLMASDFNSIIGNLNAASNEFSTGLVNRAIDYATPQFETANVPGVGLVEYQKDSLGQITGQRVIAPEQAQPYKTATFEQNGTMYQYYTDPKTGAAVSAPEPIFSSPQSQQYKYETFTQDGTIYQYATDPTTGKAVSAPEIISQGQSTQGGNTFQYTTDTVTGTIYEQTYGANGQLQSINPIGKMPAGADTSQQPDLRSVSGVGLVAVNPDGTYKVVVPEKEKAPTPTQQDKQTAEIQQYKQAMMNSVGPDGKVNSEVYGNALRSWDGTTKEFLSIFPPNVYLNPDYSSNDEYFALVDGY